MANKRLKRKIIYLITLLYILASGSVIGFVLHNIFVDICICLLELGYIIFLSKNIIISRKYKFLIFFLFLFIWSQFIAYSGSVIYALRFLLLTIISTSFFNAIYLDKINIFQYFEHIVRALTIINLVLYILCSLLKIISPLNIVSNDLLAYYTNYYYLYFEIPFAVVNIGPVTIQRNTGIFWEPGVWQLYVNIALLIYLLKNEKKKIYVILLYSAAIVTTFSTTGLILYMGIILYMELVYKKSLLKKTFAAILGAGAFFVSVQLLISKIDNYTASFVYRMSDFYNSFKVLRQSFLVGCGLNNDKLFMIYSEGRGNTNGVLAWLCYTGIIGAVIILFPLLKNWIAIRKKDERFFFFFVIILLLIINMSEPIFTFAFNIAVISLLYSEILPFRNGDKLQ